MKTKAELIEALRKFVAQRSGIDYRNYGGSREAFMGDYRTILQHGRDARELLRHIELRDSITGAMLEQSLTGRLSYRNGEIEYVTGQYFPTEYRLAICRALAECLWHWLRYGGGTLDTSAEGIRKTAVRCFGRGIARRWFN
jgi:hypothetical protein